MKNRDHEYLYQTPTQNIRIKAWGWQDAEKKVKRLKKEIIPKEKGILYTRCGGGKI